MTASPAPSGLHSLLNYGMQVLNGPGEPEPATYVVLGLARSGTSMIARCLHALGVPMGDKLSAVYEDVVVSRAMEGGTLEQVREVVAQRNAQHPRWGFKRPAAIHFIERYERELRNPRYIVVFRDVLAIANRNRISIEQDLLQGLRTAAQEYQTLVELVSALRRPTLLVSYEKALLEPEAFVEAMAAFTGTAQGESRRAALAAIEPGGDAYLEQSRARRSLGRIDRVSDEGVAGWALMTGVSGPVEVRICLNQIPVATVRAERPRPDLNRPGLPPGNACGFQFDWPAGTVLTPGDSVEARVVGEIRDLARSPYLVPAPRRPLRRPPGTS